MEIREIRIQKFACWERVRIPALSPALNVIHLQDGGRPVDFARFMHGMFYGFAPGHEGERRGGALVCHAADDEWTLARQRIGSERGQWKLHSANSPRSSAASWQHLRGPISADMAHLFLRGPADDAAVLKGWQSVEQKPELLEWLLRGPHPWLQPASEIPLDEHGRVIQQLAETRELLLAELSGLRAQSRLSTGANTAHAPRQAEIADLTDELRELRQRRQTLEVALELAPVRAELETLQRELANSRGDISALRPLHEEYQRLEEERKDRESQLAQLERPTPRASDVTPELLNVELEVRDLLDQRRKILLLWRKASGDGSTEADSPQVDEFTAPQRMLDAKRKLDASRLEYDRIRHRVAEGDVSPMPVRSVFNAAGESELQAETEPFDDRDTGNRLHELRRRRLWVREEASCLLRRQQLPGARTLALTLLFCLSVACLFGVLMVRVSPAQWALTALGLCGMAAAGAIKLAVEQREARLLHRCKARLLQLDAEIERLSATPPEVPLVDDQPLDHEEATDPHARLAVSRRRVDEAEASFRSLSRLYNLPDSLTPAQALKALARRVHVQASPRPRRVDQLPPRLRSWIKRARQVCRQVDGDHASSGVEALLDRLEAIHRQIRDQTHDQQSSSAQRTELRTLIKQQRAAIGRLRARQQAILTETAVEDEFALSAAVEAAEKIPPKQRRLVRLGRDLDIAMDGLVDREELSELLHSDTRNELAAQRQAVDRRIAQVEQELERLRVEPPRWEVGLAAGGRELDGLQLRLAQVDARIRNAVQVAQQAAVLRRIAAEMLARRRDRMGELLGQLTANAWTTLDVHQGRIRLTSADHQSWTLAECDPSVLRVAWLALQLAASEKVGRRKCLPLIVSGEWAVATGAIARQIVPVLVDAAAHGQQVLVVVSDSRAAARWMKLGMPVVAVSLREVDPAAPANSVLGRAARAA